MNEHDADAVQPQPEEPATTPSTPTTATRTPWRERTYRLRAIAAVTVASLLIGGVGGAAIGAAIDDGGSHHHPDRAGLGGRPGGSGPHQPPTGQLPPSTAPQDQSEGSNSTNS